MEQDFFQSLPSEIIINILSRLPLRSIAISKCVCKPWLHLLQTHDFINSHLSKSAPALALLGSHLFELGDRLDLHHHYKPLAEFDHTTFTTFPNSDIEIQGSANGLLLLWDLSSTHPHTLYVCNPITREYVVVNPPRQLDAFTTTYGFGVSKRSLQHKIVAISGESGCRVYTLGMGAWRSCNESGSGGALDYTCLTYGVFLNGNLHWLVSNSEGREWISCFDLETERFSALLPTPSLPQGESLGSLFVLKDCLCLTDYSSPAELAFWFMNEYGVGKSWVKEFVISRMPHPIFEPCEAVYPFQIFKNGDVLMACEDYFLFYYSIKNKSTHKVYLHEPSRPIRVNAIIHTPSFLSLKSLGMENVRAF